MTGLLETLIELLQNHPTAVPAVILAAWVIQMYREKKREKEYHQTHIETLKEDHTKEVNRLCDEKDLIRNERDDAQDRLETVRTEQLEEMKQNRELLEEMWSGYRQSMNAGQGLN